MTVAINSVLIPVRAMAPERVDSLEAVARSKLLEVAMRELKVKTDEKLVMRQMMPTDLGLTNEVWFETTGATAKQYETSGIASKEISDERFVAITGVLDNSEGAPVSALRFTVGGSKVAEWSLDRLSQDGYREGIALSPIIITQNQAVTIEHYVKTANSGTEIILIGIICEKVGKKLKP